VLHDLIEAELRAVRDRTNALLEPLAEADLRNSPSPLMSPLVWDLAHVGNYEDQWLIRALGGDGPGVAYDDLYDAFRHPRRDRPSLPLLSPTAARAYNHEVRGRALDLLARADLADADTPLLRDGFVYGMVVQHEHQHDETMLATLQLMPDGRFPAPPATELIAPARPASGAREVLVPAGPFVMGTDVEPWAYDNERPAHWRELPAFWIDVFPVTNAEYLAFIHDGGYRRPELWTEAGWAWRQEAGLTGPQFWEGSGPSAEGWCRRRFGRREPVPADEPVQHVCWYEADAYARWAGGRLPTEPEWEKAASWDPAAGRKRRFPWGDDEPTAAHANLGGGRFGPAPVGSFGAGASAYGCQQMIGDVWEWTASPFAGHPRFVSFPYREYSEVFFGTDYRVLRGGSWATHRSAVRATFRNWDYPIRRQIFAGFRCARDA
jgi:iron(II)-dependent oxidoreductase